MSPYPKRLIEVDLPIKKISAHARREKSIRHGHISTLHIWWARRPLAACRAVICAALWPDPGDPNCPESFKTEAASLMESFRDKRGGKPYEWNNGIELRKALLDFIADFANWDNSTNKDFLDTSRALTQVAHESLGGEPGTRPLVVDPFAGGGSIPLEALRVGADAFASDLNPVAVLLNKVVLEYIPKYGQRLAEEVRKWGEWVKKEAEKELAEYYPKDPDGATPIAYLWARTIKCEGPGCGAEVPLMRSLWLAKKGFRSVALRLKPDNKNKRVDFEIVKNALSKDVAEGTVRRGSATCPVCGFTTPQTSVRSQLKGKDGGANNSRLLAVALKKHSEAGVFFRLAEAKDTKLLVLAEKRLSERFSNSIPRQQIRSKNQSDVGRMPLYGMSNYGSLFTHRQLLTLLTIASLIERLDTKLSSKQNAVLRLCLACALDKQVDYLSSLSRWHTSGQFVNNTYGRQALPMVWDFVEACPFSGASGNYLGAVEWVSRFVEQEGKGLVGCGLGQAERATATRHPLSDDIADALITDPPYYDAIGYSNLSEFFYVWLRRSVSDIFSSLLSAELPDKTTECIVDTSVAQDQSYFLRTMTEALSESRRYCKPNSIGVVVFAHSSTSAWEAMLDSLNKAGWIVTASWPIDTEMANRMNAMGTAALASSVHIVCRPRENPDGSLCADEIGDWRDVLAELPKRIHEWMPRLAEEGVVGADAIFACLGPALEIFSRYSRVEKASGEVVPLKEYLEHVWAAVAKEALNMIFAGAETTGFEEDARLTAMWLWTLSTGDAPSPQPSPSRGEGEEDTDEDEDSSSAKAKLSGYTLEYDAARKIAQGLGAHLERLQSLIEVKGDKARLLPVAERTRALFGKDEAETPKVKKKKKEQLSMFAEIEEAEEAGTWGAKNVPQLGNTTLDRLHQAMILFAAGRGEALKRFLVDEGVGRDERFWRLAQAFSALYPKNTDEKRWVDGVLARKKGLGL